MNTFDVKILANSLKRKISGWRINKAFGDNSNFIIHIGDIDNSSEAGSLVFMKERDFSTLHYEASFPNPHRRSWVPNIVGLEIDDIIAIDSDRIIKIELIGDRGLRLYFELTGRHGNIILCDSEDRIITCLVKIGSELSSYRNLLAGEVYKSPPPMKRLCPSAIQSNHIWANWISNHDLAFTESTVRSRMFWDSFFDNISETEQAIDFIGRVLNGKQPLYLLETEIIPFEISNSVKFENHLSIFEQISRQQIGKVKGDHYFAVLDEIKKLSKKLKSLEKEFENWQDEDYYRQRGDTLAANLYQVKKSDKKVLLHNVHNYDETFEIELRGELSPSENVNFWYKTAKKAASIKKKLPPMIRELKEQISRLNESLEDPNLYHAIAKSLHKSQPKVTRKQTLEKKNYREFHYKGFPIYVGKNAQGNDYVTLRLAKPHDIWLHARGVPGSHVLIKLNKKQQAPHDLLIIAAQIASFYSNNKNQPVSEVIHTQRRWLQKVKGKAGAVRTLQDKTIIVKKISDKDVSKYRI